MFIESLLESMLTYYQFLLLLYMFIWKPLGLHDYNFFIESKRLHLNAV